MAGIPSFSESAAQAAIESAQAFYEERRRKDGAHKLGIDDGHVSTLSECITATVNDGKVCVNLPLGLGQVCLPIPIPYNGQVASACISICTTWGIPTGVRLTISVGGVVIVSKTFLKC